MNETQIRKPVFDLEERTAKFAVDCRRYLRHFKRSPDNVDDIRQLIRSSGSVAANYIEANEALSRKDFRHRVMITRKEAKESILWLSLLQMDDSITSERNTLIDEAEQLVKIFGSILMKTKP